MSRVSPECPLEEPQHPLKLAGPELGLTEGVGLDSAPDQSRLRRPVDQEDVPLVEDVHLRRNQEAAIFLLVGLHLFGCLTAVVEQRLSYRASDLFPRGAYEAVIAPLPLVREEALRLDGHVSERGIGLVVTDRLASAPPTNASVFPLRETRVGAFREFPFELNSKALLVADEHHRTIPKNRRTSIGIRLIGMPPTPPVIPLKCAPPALSGKYR